jgi:RNA polymerase sigma-70 factor, ECF subfamily
MTDTDLVRAFKNGDKDSFSELVRKYTKPLTMMIMRIVKDPEEAKDLSQTAFLKAYEGLAGFEMASSFKTWLYSIAMNTAKDYLRKHKPDLDPIVDRTPDHREAPPEIIDRERKLKKIRDAIELLPEKQRLTLRLRVYEEMNYKEIAATLGGTEGGARVNFFQATKALKDSLEEKK